jgi:hypothetical protein
MPNLSLGFRFALLDPVGLGLSFGSMFLSSAHLFHTSLLLHHLFVIQVIYVSHTLIDYFVGALTRLIDFFDGLKQMLTL